MTGGQQRKIAYVASALALLLTASLLVMPAQARYSKNAQWQSVIPAQTVSPTDFLYAACAREKSDILQLGSWRAVADETQTVSLLLTSPAVDGETVPTERVVSFTAQSGNEQLLVASTAVSQSVSPGHSYSIPLSLQRTALAVDKDTAVTVVLTGSSEGATVLHSVCRIVLKPVTEPVETVETDTLFGHCMTSYDPTQPFCVSYALPANCVSAEMQLGGGSFPAGTRYSMDGGLTHAALSVAGTIPLDTAACSLLVDLDNTVMHSTTTPIDVTLAVATATQLRKQTVTLTYEKWAGDIEPLTAADGAITGACTTWGGEFCTAELQVSVLRRSISMVQDLEHPEAPPQTVTELFYEEADSGLFTQCGTTISDELTGAMLDYRGVETNETTPAGSYLLAVTWKLDGMTVTEKKYPFFISR